jgi:hypothetical protein
MINKHDRNVTGSSSTQKGTFRKEVVGPYRSFHLLPPVGSVDQMDQDSAGKPATTRTFEYNHELCLGERVLACSFKA